MHASVDSPVCVRAMPARTGRRALSRGLVVVAAAMFVTPGCKVARPGTSPAATWDALRGAVLGGDYESVWNMLSRKAREREAERIRSMQQLVEGSLNDMNGGAREEFRRQIGFSVDEYMNLSPAEFFATEVVKSTEFVLVRKAMSGAAIKGAETSGDSAVVTLDVAGAKEGRLALVREHGLWRLPDIQDLVALGTLVRGPGDSPEETLASLISCVRNGAYREVWDLVCAQTRDNMGRLIREQQEKAPDMPEQDRRLFERDRGVSVEEYAAMPPGEAFGVIFGASLHAPAIPNERNGPTRLEVFLTSMIEGSAVTEASATLRIRPPGTGPGMKIKMIFEKARWRLVDF